MLASLSTVEPQSGQPEDIKEESEVFTTTNEQDQGAQRKDLASSSPSPSPIQNEHEVAGPPPSASSPRPLSTRLNSRGVRFTQKEPNIIFDNMVCLSLCFHVPLCSLVWQQTPFGVPCIAELLRFLTSLINLKDKQNTPIQIGLGLHLIVIALEAGSHQLHVSALLCQVIIMTLAPCAFIFSFVINISRVNFVSLWIMTSCVVLSACLEATTSSCSQPHCVESS